MKSMNKRRLVFIFVACCMLIFFGCDTNIFESAEDDSSYDAKFEEAIMKLDAGDYDKAFDILTKLQAKRPEDQELNQYISSACAGMVGLDSYHLLEIADSLSENDNDSAIDLVGITLGDENAALTAEEIDIKLQKFSGCAIPQLLAITDPTDDQIIQLGLFSLNRAVLTIAQIVVEDQALPAITLTAAGIRGIYAAEAFVFNGAVDDPRLEYLGDDIIRIGASVEAIERLDEEFEENDLYDFFDAFARSLDADRNGDISAVELTIFINSL